jgi:hypothetical protein
MSHKLVYCLVFLFLSSIAAIAQFPTDDLDYDEGGPATSAGGNWTVQRSEDRMTAAKRVRLELPADNSGDSDERAAIILYCSDGKLKLADFSPNMNLSGPNWAGFWGQPQLRVRVRADNAHAERSWNWVNGHFLAMDKAATSALIGSHLFRIEFPTPEGRRIAEFSPAGLDLKLVRSACGLEPKKP